MNTGLPHIEISTDGAFSHIKIDGEEIHGVHGYALSQCAGEIPVLKLELIATDTTIDGVALPEVLMPFYNPDDDSDEAN